MSARLMWEKVKFRKRLWVLLSVSVPWSESSKEEMEAF